MKACLNASIHSRLQLQSNGRAIEGNNGVKGCYAVGKSSFFEPEEHSINDHLKALVKPMFRPNGYDCGNVLSDIQKL